jgi:gliding motility-associated-like protein
MMRTVVIALFSLLCTLGYAQSDFYMSNSSTSDCKGNFYDSDNNQVASGDYDHNEDFIFTICIPGATEVSLTFTSFCTEAVEDYLIFYQGSDTTATKITGKISGSTNPGTITSRDSCMTIYFHSDKSVSCDGWEAYWTTKIAPLTPPVFVSPPVVSCEDDFLSFRLDDQCPCDSIADSNFTLTGPVAATVTGVTPINCTNGTTDTFRLTLDRELDLGGRYTLDMDITKYDVCDSAWDLNSSVTFDITDCPIEVDLDAVPDTICAGTCTEITATVTGGDASNYVFNWDNGITGTYGPHTFCPTTSTWVKLTVSDGVSVPDTDSVYISVITPPQTQNDTMVCRTNPAFNLTANPSGGTWRGDGITNAALGTFDPMTAGAGIDTVYYELGGCIDSVLVNVRNINAGRPNASCPNGPPFNVFNFSPAGGTWSGNNITSAGVFTPTTPGVYTVTYEWNGCTDTKTINVSDISVPATDTVCISTVQKQLTFTPVGGRWSGNGFTNTLNGIFYPPDAGAGNHQLIYNANGCRDTMDMFVVDINARWNEVACPDEDSFFVIQGLPAGGYWTGRGIIDSSTGLYDPSFVYDINRINYNDSLWYHLNGCRDFKMMYVRQTIIYDDTAKFCIEDDRLLLDWAGVRRSPGGGVWQGNGINGNFFEPRTAGHGIHEIKYTANNCSDSMIMVVHPAVTLQADTNFCITDPPFDLYVDATGGLWNGPGIVSAAVGTFAPSAAGVGVHTIYYATSEGCLDSIELTVDARPIASISGSLPSYCMVNQGFALQGNPAGGNWTGNGMTGNQFNPWTVGTGTHKVYYTYGSPTCNSSDSVDLTVIDTLLPIISIDDDSLCIGDNAILTASGAGGIKGNYSYGWSTGDAGVNSIIVSPSSDQTYTVTINDGCSEPNTADVLVRVFPDVHVTVNSSPIQCYGEIGFVELQPLGPDPLDITWYTSPPRSGYRLDAPVTNTYSFTARNNRTGCQLDSSAEIPGYPLINAFFLTAPREGICLDPFNPEVQIINQSAGGIRGTWFFGDGSQQAYDPLVNPSHRYRADSTQYTIKLIIENEGGCQDSATGTVCLNDSVILYIPTAFTPGSKSEGINDTYFIRSAGVDEFELIIFNRWGEQVFQTTDKDFTWDGTYNGSLLPNGVYGYVVKYKGEKTTFRSAKGVMSILR